MTAVAYAFLIQLVLVCSSFVSRGISTNETSDISTGYITIVLYNFVLLGLLRLFEVLSNPLGDDAADFPGDSYMVSFERNLYNMLVNAFALVHSDGLLGPVVSGVVTLVPSSKRKEEKDISTSSPLMTSAAVESETCSAFNPIFISSSGL